ncbi:MAG: hypothetical protein ACTSSQ_01200 [Alphaproteobacteria bacterium]
MATSETIHQGSEPDYLSHLLRGIDAFEASGYCDGPEDWRDGLRSIRRSVRHRLREIDGPCDQDTRPVSRLAR